MGVNIDGQEVLLPTVSDEGRLLEPEAAIAEYKRTGKHLGVYSSVEASNRGAERLHKEQEAMLPFFGLPNETRRAEKVRKNQAKLYEDTWLDEFIQGMFGKEQAGGSVLDPDRQKKTQANDWGQKLGIASDVATPLKATALGVMPLLAGAIGRGVPKLAASLFQAPAKPLDSFIQHASRAPWDESRRAYNIPTTDAVSEAVQLVGPEEYRRLAKAYPIANDSPEWSAISNEMVARQILDHFDRLSGK
jgi:hypothetical protein